MSDRELEVRIARTAEGDVDALHELYDELGSAVFAVARAITDDRQLAEDVLQDVFLNVYSGAHGYRAGGKPRAWVLRIARNRAISLLRRRKRELPSPDGTMPERLAENNTETVPEHVALKEAMEGLPQADREIVVLSAVGGLTNRDVARVLGMPQGSVSWRYRKALERLRNTLTGFSMERGRTECRNSTRIR